jgi:DNA-binding Lrp family transcriptional regulator
VIERTVAVVAPQALGVGLSAVVEVTLDRQGAEHLDAFEARAVAELAVQQRSARLARAGFRAGGARAGHAGLPWRWRSGSSRRTRTWRMRD